MTSAKLKRPWYEEVYFLKLNMSVYLRTQFEVSNVIVTSFRKRVILPQPPNQPLKSPPRLGLPRKKQ